MPRDPLLRLLLLLAVVLSSSTARAQIGPCCVVPDNGTGTADHPPACLAGYTGAMQIVNGLPLGSTLDMNVVLGSFAGLSQLPGGTLGGAEENWTASLQVTISGTGAFAGYNRVLVIPITTGHTDSAPRVLFSPLQSFDTALMNLFGQIIGDPDFDLLRLTAGTNFGLPGTGHTIFTSAPGGWAVDSYIDTAYRLDFVGNPGGPFAGRSGSTALDTRLQMCHDRPTPARSTTWGRIKQMYR